MICDTSGLLSAFGTDQGHHEESASALLGADRRVVSPMVLAELDYITGQRAGHVRAIETMRELTSPAYEIAPFTSADLLSALGIMETYSDLEIGITDASLVVLAKRYRTNEILTLDQRHFRAMRGLDGRHFKLLPLDADDQPA